MGWTIVIPALLLVGWAVGSGMLARRGNVRIGGLIGGHRMATPAVEKEKAAEKDLAPAVVERLGDLRLSALRSAAESWRRSAAPRRLVVDQVCLVPDLPTFLEAIASWDERHYFPILIDEPAWTLPFLRAFHPARVVRYTGRKRVPGSTSDIKCAGAGASARGETAWQKAIEAVRRACSTPPAPDAATKGAAGSTGPGRADAGPGAGGSGQRDHRGRRRAGCGALSAPGAPGGFPSATRRTGCGREHSAVR